MSPPGGVTWEGHSCSSALETLSDNSDDLWCIQVRHICSLFKCSVIKKLRTKLRLLLIWITMFTKHSHTKWRRRVSARKDSEDDRKDGRLMLIIFSDKNLLCCASLGANNTFEKHQRHQEVMSHETASCVSCSVFTECRTQTIICHLRNKVR